MNDNQTNASSTKNIQFNLSKHICRVRTGSHEYILNNENHISSDDNISISSSDKASHVPIKSIIEPFGKLRTPEHQYNRNNEN